MAHEHVVDAGDQAGGFEADEVLGLFDDDDLGLVAAVIRADVAEFAVGKVEAA